MGITSLVGGLVTAKKQKKAARRAAAAEQQRVAAEKESQRIQQVRANVEVRRERQQQLREQRIRRASILAASVNAGAGAGTTTTEGALGGLNTQFGANIGRINVAQGFGEAISEQSEKGAAAAGEVSRQQGKSQIAAAQGQIFQAIGGFEQSIFERAGGFTSLFGGNKPAGT